MTDTRAARLKGIRERVAKAAEAAAGEALRFQVAMTEAEYEMWEEAPIDIQYLLGLLDEVEREDRVVLEAKEETP